MSILDDYNEVDNIIEDPRFGPIKLFMNKYINTKTLIKKSVQLKTKKEFQISKYQIEERLFLDHDNILKILEIDFCEENLISSIFFEYPEKTLETKKMDLKDGKKMFIEILQAIIYLKSKKMAHGDIRPNFIHYDKIEDKYILIDRMKSDKTFLECQRDNIDNFQGLYMAPYVFDNLVIENFDIKYKIYKNDVFSLGLIFLEILEGKDIIQELYDFENYFFDKIKFNNLIKEVSERIYDEDIKKLIFILINDVFVFEEQNILTLKKILDKILNEKEEPQKKFYNPFEFVDLNKSDFEKKDKKKEKLEANYKSNKVKKKKSLFSSIKNIKVNKHMKINTDAKSMNLLMMTHDEDLLEKKKIKIKNDKKDDIQNGKKYFKLNYFNDNLNLQSPSKLNIFNDSGINIINLEKEINFNNENINLEKNNNIESDKKIEENNLEVFNYYENFGIVMKLENEIKEKTLEQMIKENEHFNDLEIYKSEKKEKKKFKFSNLRNVLKTVDNRSKSRNRKKFSSNNSVYNFSQSKSTNKKPKNLKTVNIFNYNKKSKSPFRSSQIIRNNNFNKNFVENIEILSFPMLKDILFDFEIKENLINKKNLENPLINEIDISKRKIANIFEKIKKIDLVKKKEKKSSKNIIISNTWSMMAQKSERNLNFTNNFSNLGDSSVSNQSLDFNKKITQKKNFLLYNEKNIDQKNIRKDKLKNLRIEKHKNFMLYNERKRKKRNVNNSIFKEKKIDNADSIISNKSKDNYDYKSYHQEKNDNKIFNSNQKSSFYKKEIKNLDEILSNKSKDINNFSKMEKVSSIRSTDQRAKIQRISYTTNCSWVNSNFSNIKNNNKKNNDNKILDLNNQKNVNTFSSEQFIKVFSKK